MSDISSIRSIERCDSGTNVRGLRTCEDEEAMDLESERINRKGLKLIRCDYLNLQCCC